MINGCFNEKNYSAVVTVSFPSAGCGFVDIYRLFVAFKHPGIEHHEIGHVRVFDGW